MSTQVPRFGHGSRVPGWDEAADLTKDPAEIPDPALTPVPDELRRQIEDYMSRYPDSRSASIPSMAAAQKLHGWLSPEAFEQVACVMRVTPAFLSSVATFYDMLNTRPLGRTQVYVCTNISCSLCGAQELLARLEQLIGDEPDVNLRGFECLGACDIAPMVSVDGVYVGPVDEQEIPALAEQIRSGAEPLPDKQLIRRRCADLEANSNPEWGELPPVVHG